MKKALSIIFALCMAVLTVVPAFAFELDTAEAAAVLAEATAEEEDNNH